MGQVTTNRPEPLDAAGDLTALFARPATLDLFVDIATGGGEAGSPGDLSSDTDGLTHVHPAGAAAARLEACLAPDHALAAHLILAIECQGTTASRLLAGPQEQDVVTAQHHVRVDGQAATCRCKQKDLRRNIYNHALYSGLRDMSMLNSMLINIKITVVASLWLPA